jgi:hypothetical protein
MESNTKSNSTRSRRLRDVPDRFVRSRAPYLIALVSLCLCAAALATDFGPWQVWMGAELVLVTAVAFQSIPAAIAVLIAISPYNSAIRWVAGDSALIRGLRDVMSYLIFAVFLYRYWGQGRTQKHSWIVFYFAGWCIFVQLINQSSLLVGALGLRQLVQFFLLFPVIVAVLQGSERSSAEDLLEVIVITAGVLSVVQFANHLGYIHLPLPESEEMSRKLWDVDVPRLIPIWEVSPSGLAIYMVAAALIVIARFVETGGVPALWWPCLAGSLACAWLTLSHSGVVAMVVGLGVIAACSRKRTFGAAILGVAVVAFLPILFGKSSFTDENTAEYSTTFAKLWAQSLQSALTHPIFGTGASPAGYLADLLDSESRTIGDGGWPLFACQVGIPMAAVMLIWAASILWNAARGLMAKTSSSARATRWVLLGALASACVYFVNAHGVPWYRVGADVNFIVLVAILAALTQPTGGYMQLLKAKLRRPSLKEAAGAAVVGAGPSRSSTANRAERAGAY